MTAGYVIWAPPFTHRSGGVRALYALCAALRAEGYSAAIQMMDNGHEYDGPWIDCPYDASPVDHLWNAFWSDDDTIVVYPETIVGNPADAAMFVRWMLGPVERDGVCFQWVPSIGDKPVLHVPIIEADLFYPRVGNRAGSALWVGKASAEHRARWFPTDVDVIEIHRDVPATRAELADLLGSVDRLISLDAYSALNLEAPMCGTPVRVFSEPRWPVLQASDREFVSKCGIAYDDQPWWLATDTVHMAYDRYVAAFPRMHESLLQFVAITQAYATQGWPT